MSFGELQPGDVIMMERFTQIIGHKGKGSEHVEFTFGKMKNGRQYGFLLLGGGSVEQPMDANKNLNMLGWVYDPEAANKQLAERNAEEVA